MERGKNGKKSGHEMKLVQRGNDFDTSVVTMKIFDTINGIVNMRMLKDGQVTPQ